MSPEEEAKLRAKMAQVRAEVDGPAIDLDEPDYQPTEDDRVKEKLGYITGTAYAPAIDNAVQGAGFQQREMPGFVRSYLDYMHAQGEKTNAVRTGQQPGEKSIVEYTPAGYVAGKIIRGADRAITESNKDKAYRDEQDAKLKAISEQEETYKRAMEVAKRIAAAKAQQAKATSDRDEAAKEGRPGYRVERPLYGVGK